MLVSYLAIVFVLRIGRNSDHYAPEFSIRYVTKHCDLFKIVFSLQSALARFEIDVDRLLASLVQIPKHDTEKTREARTNTCILIKHVTELVPVLVVSSVSSTTSI